MSKLPGIFGRLDVRLNVLGHVDVSYTSKRTLTYTLGKFSVCLTHSKHPMLLPSSSSFTATLSFCYVLCNANLDPSGGSLSPVAGLQPFAQPTKPCQPSQTIPAGWQSTNKHCVITVLRKLKTETLLTQG